MAKHTRSARKQNHGKGNAETLEYHESHDDSLLPASTEIKELQSIDPQTLPWIKQRTEKEQDSRLDFNDRKMKVIERGQKMAFSADIIAMSFAFVIVMSGMYLSYNLITKDQIVTGSVFGGATIALAAVSFLNFRKSKKQNTN